MGRRRDGERGGSAGPGGSGYGGVTDVGLLALGSRRELTIANCCAKLLAKYVSPRHIRLLRGRFMVSRNAVFALKWVHADRYESDKAILIVLWHD